jgi:energy-converting hydrogenase A subunit R
VKRTKRVFVTDCEGPISKNDNAFELACHFIPQGEKFFTQISRYDDVLADVVKREDYKAGNTLKLIVPFFKAYGVTDKTIVEFSAQNILLMLGAKEALQFLKNVMPSFIVSTSYEHYIRALCRVLDFPCENTYCTTLSIDAYHMGKKEQKKLKEFRQEICAMPLIEVPEGAKSLQDFSERDQKTIERLDEVFWEEIMQLESGAIFEEISPVGGVDKAKAVRNIVEKIGSILSNVIYIGDSITDVKCFRLVRKKGGVTISFNGNIYAVREAEIAVLSANALVIAVFADVFRRVGKESVLDLVENWGYTGLTRFNVNPLLQEKLRNLFPKTLPKVQRITKGNMRELASESGAFRKRVRGERVGRLG